MKDCLEGLFASACPSLSKEQRGIDVSGTLVLFELDPLCIEPLR